MLGYLLGMPADKARAEGKPRVVDLNDAPSTGRAGVLQEELGKREGTSAVVFAGACRTRIRIAPRGAEEAQEGLSYDVEALRYSGGTEGGHFERMEVVGGRGGSLQTSPTCAP